jgi:hypothetical protein
MPSSVRRSGAAIVVVAAVEAVVAVVVAVGDPLRMVQTRTNNKPKGCLAKRQPLELFHFFQNLCPKWAISNALIGEISRR